MYSQSSYSSSYSIGMHIYLLAVRGDRKEHLFCPGVSDFLSVCTFFVLFTLFVVLTKFVKSVTGDPCGLEEARHLGGSYHLHLHG
jgi:hypothetical protein